MRAILSLFLLLFLASGCNKSADVAVVYIDAIDETGERVTSTAVATVWSSNGEYWDDNGVLFEPTDDQLPQIWDDEGEMAPLPSRRLTRHQSGLFAMDRPNSNVSVVYAISETAGLGGTAFVTPETTDTVRITMRPMVRVFGKLQCESKIPEWTHVYVYANGSPKPPD